jgi:His-Xaa-Ser system protein HxsD
LNDSAISFSQFSGGSDELGPFVRISIDPTVFSETAVLKTAYWFTDQYYVFIAKDRSSGLVGVELRAKSGSSVDSLKGAVGEFSNQLLDYDVRQRVFAETSAVRDTLIKKAFFEAKAPPPPGLLCADNEPPGGPSTSGVKP